MNIPSIVYAGDSITWDDGATTDTLGNVIDSASWTLSYAIRGPVNLSLTASAQGSGWRTTMSAANSTTLSKEGFYFFQAYATNGSSRITLGAGRIEVKKNLATLSTTDFDGRSQLRKDLDAVQQAIRAIIHGGAIQTYFIGHRKVEKIPMPDLLVLESRLKAQVTREEAAQKVADGKGNPNNLYVRFK